MEKTVTRLTLVEAVSQKCSISKSEAARLVDSVLHHMGGASLEGQGVKLSNFGSFQIRERVPRIGRNPRTGETHPVSARKVVVFTPSGALKERMNGDAVEQAGPQ